MGDPWKKVLPGQELSIPAQAYNAFIDAALAHKGLNVGGPKAAERSLPSGAPQIRVRNATAGALARFAAVGLNGVAIAPTANLAGFQNTPIMNTAAPGVTTYLGRFAVLQEPLISGMVGNAVLAGVTVAQISVVDTTHDRADVDTSGGALLVSSYYGAAEILYAEAGTGTKWAILRIGSFVSPVLKATANGTIAVGGSGSVTVKRNGASTQTVTAHLNWMDGNQQVPANNELLIQFFRDENKWIIVGAECV